MPNTTRRILIVDDDDLVRASLARGLSQGGRFEVETAADGFEAGFRMGAGVPDLVIVDVVMPGMSGLEICHRMRAMSSHRRPLKIIVLTGYPATGASEQSLISGADLFLIKPQSMDALLAHVDDLLDD